jgi:hypothetical protein
LRANARGSVVVTNGDEKGEIEKLVQALRLCFIPIMY